MCWRKTSKFCMLKPQIDWKVQPVLTKNIHLPKLWERTAAIFGQGSFARAYCESGTENQQIVVKISKKWVSSAQRLLTIRAHVEFGYMHTMPGAIAQSNQPLPTRARVFHGEGQWACHCQWKTIRTVFRTLLIWSLVKHTLYAWQNLCSQRAICPSW
jgi:hypothetical protein